MNASKQTKKTFLHSATLFFSTCQKLRPLDKFPTGQPFLSGFSFELFYTLTFFILISENLAPRWAPSVKYKNIKSRIYFVLEVICKLAPNVGSKELIPRRSPILTIAVNLIWTSRELT